MRHLVVVFLLGAGFLSAQEPVMTETSPIKLIPRYEAGYVKVLQHLYRSGTEADGNTTYNYITQGGQEILFPYQRFTLDIQAWDRHWITAVYQPIGLATQAVAGRNGTGAVQIDGILFNPGESMDLFYGFDFWRLSYFYDFWEDEDTVLGFGLSIQFRNASVRFANAEGTKLAVSQDLGIVPILKFRAGARYENGFGWEAEADGFYASSAFFNGAEFPFTGWIWDAAVQGSMAFVGPSRAFLSLRSIGGGAEGTSGARTIATESISPNAYNALATLALTFGFTIESP